MKTHETALEQVGQIFAHFHEPFHRAEVFLPSEGTHYVWQHMSEFYHSAQVLRDGPIHPLPERFDPAIGRIRVRFREGQNLQIDEYVTASTMDGILVLRGGDILFERYKRMRSFDKHNWFSCSKTLVSTLLAILEHEGKVDVLQPVARYLSDLAGSEWDEVTIEQTLDMATGLDSTEHEEPDARSNPACGWYQWAESIGLFPAVNGVAKSPVEVLRKMKRTKPAHTAFEYNSINTYVCQRIVETITGTPLAELYGNRVWRRIGAENDGYLGLDRQGCAMGFGWMNSTLRDLGRHGMIYTPSARCFGKDPIVPPEVLDKFRTGLRPRMYARGSMGASLQNTFFSVPGLANRYQWDIVTPETGNLFKAGMGGQGLWVSPAKDAVVAFFGTGNQQDRDHSAWIGYHILEAL